MKKAYLIFLASIIHFLTGCINEDHYGLSPHGNIKSIEVNNQAKQAVINADTKTITIEMPPGIDLSNIAIKKLELSSFASANKQIGDSLNLTENASIQITAEDKSTTLWNIKPLIASSTPQLDNSGFNKWYQTSEQFYEPGNSATSTIWGTGNAGSNSIGIIASAPIEVGNNDFAAQLTTQYNGSLPAAFGARISSGSIFTGKFDKEKIDPSNPQAAIDFGTPFTGRPKAFKIMYKYTPGSENQDKNENPLPFGDQCDIYAFLEVRSSNSTRRLATAWFRSGDRVNDFTALQQDLIYGALDSSQPDYTKPANGQYVQGDSVKFILPTHITFVAASSFDGANFAGAVGSQLVIDNLELIYE